MPRHRKASTRSLTPFVTTGMAGAALVSSGLLINLSHAGLRTQPADAELTAVQCALGDTLCSDTTLSLVAAPKAAATAATAR